MRVCVRAQTVLSVPVRPPMLKCTYIMEAPDATAHRASRDADLLEDPWRLVTILWFLSRLAREDNHRSRSTWRGVGWLSFMHAAALAGLNQSDVNIPSQFSFQVYHLFGRLQGDVCDDSLLSAMAVYWNET